MEHEIETTDNKITPRIEQYRREVMRAGLQNWINSKLLPAHIKTVDQAEVIAVMGKAVGLHPMVALQNTYLIQGKLTITPAMMLALAKQKGLVADQSLENGENEVKFTILRKGYLTPHVEVFGDKEAKALGLDKKDNYIKQKMVMYRWRTISAAMRFMFPDVVFGLYTPEEMGAIIDVNPENDLEAVSVHPETELIVKQPEEPIPPRMQMLAMVSQIIDRLASEEGGDVDKIEALLNRLTSGKITTSDLERLIDEKPRWIMKLKKVMDEQRIGIKDQMASETELKNETIEQV